MSEWIGWKPAKPDIWGGLMGFFLPIGGYPFGETCEDCNKQSLDVKSRYSQDPLLCEACHIKRLKDKCSSSA